MEQRARRSGSGGDRRRGAAEDLTMTLVCCWLDESYGSTRITAVADTRAADYDDVSDSWIPRSEQTMKLFRIRIRCHRLQDLGAKGTRDWRDPYYCSEIGIGFAGYCFEAMTIVALFSRAMEQLVADDREPRPAPNAIAEILASILRRYFVGHNNTAAHRVHFLLFGYDQTAPWIARIEFTSRGLSGPTVEPLEVGKVHVIPDENNGTFATAIQATLKRIAKHADSLREQVDVELDVEQARHRDVAKKVVEEHLIEKIEDQFNTTVGGFVQKLEVYPLGDSAAVAYTRESRSDILDHLAPAANGLRCLPIGEQLGRKPGGSAG